MDYDYDKRLIALVDDLPISLRPWNCLLHADIKYVGELVQRTEQDLLTIKNFGRHSLAEIKDVLANMGLSLGMKVLNLPPREELDHMREQQQPARNHPELNRAVSNADFNLMLWKTRRMKPVSCIDGSCARIGS